MNQHEALLATGSGADIPDTCDASITTEEVAVLFKVKPPSVLRRLSQTGSYFGIRPRKLPNRRLAWPLQAVQKLIGGLQAGEASHV